MHRFLLLCAALLCVTTAGYAACEVVTTGVRFAQAGGSKVVDAPECTTATETLSWITTSVAAGKVTITAQSNNAASTRYGRVRVGTKDIFITQYGTSSPTAVASVTGAPRKVPEADAPFQYKVAHHVSNLLIEITPLTLPQNAKADIIATSDGYFANDVADIGESYPALLTVDGSAQTFTAKFTERNELRWLDVPIGALQATATGTLRLRISRLRATGTKIALDLETTAPFVLSNADVPLTVAERVSNAITFSVGSPVAGPPGSGRFSIPVTVTETVATAFAAAQGEMPGTRFLFFGNLTSNTYSQAQTTPTNGTATAQLVSANNRGAGGTYITGDTVFSNVNYQRNGSPGPVYQVKTANDSTIESFTFNIVVVGSLAAAQDVADDLEFFLAPYLLYGVDPCNNISENRSKPVTRRSACGAQAAEIDITIDSVVVVGSNRRITYTVANTDGDEGDNAPVVVRGNAGLGYSFSSCSRDNAVCPFSGDIQELSIPDLAPGTSTTFVVEIAPTAGVPNGTLVENIFTAESEIDEETDRTNNQVTDAFVAQSCSPLTPSNPAYGAAGGTGSVNVPNCFFWTASSTASWITVTSPTPGVENFEPGTVNYTVAQYTGTSQRTGTLSIAGLGYNIIQRGACTFTVGPPNSQNVSNAASATTFALTTNPTGQNCAWTTTNDAPWFTSIVPSSGTNSQIITVNYQGNNTLAQRTGRITFRETGVTAGPFAQATITQAPGTPCTISLTTATTNIAQAGGIGTISLTTSAPTCAWTASSGRPWLQVSPASGTGAATLSYRVYPNFGSSTRTGTINAGTGAVTFTQAAIAESVTHRFVRLLYLSFLGRAATNAEVNAWVATGASRALLAKSFLRAGEFDLAGRFVAGLYVGLLNRDPEFSGWIFQRDAISSGGAKQCTLAANFVNSAEFQAQNPGLTDPNFIRLLYRQVLGREASDAEVSAWLSVLATGRGQVACTFLNSGEFRQGNDARLNAFLLYATLLLRDSTAQERGDLRDVLIVNPGALDALLELFVNSAEINLLLQ